ncbi:conjugal transfer protein TraC (plasmid) [Mesorhizobium sp. AR07]|uniref:TraC family protein n=1 Tax=Mesorhizobium sp. AR07 TaxID=2865838 RepID=UPI00215F45F2|nr:TraC family protein [Mesorhizobium sp. AR07]UVK49360.1 conjugal transfer protein TraC [Mesorhizobium sp. AR07]
MRKSSSKIRQEIERLHDQLKAAETKEAERIGRIAVKAGLSDIEIDETKLADLFAEIAGRFQSGSEKRRQAAPKPPRPPESDA